MPVSNSPSSSSSHPPSHPRRRRQRGVTLIEALIAFLVLALGILAIGRVQIHLRSGSDIARQRAEAVRVAEEDLESLRAFSVIAAASGARSYAEVESADAALDSASGYATHTRYRVQRTVQPVASGTAKSIAVTVTWSDRSGDEQQIVLTSVIAGNDPAYSALLGLAPSGSPVRGAFGRSAHIPLAAKNLGNGSSVFKPLSTAALLYVFDNASGGITARCTGTDVRTGTGTGDATAIAADATAGLGDCTPLAGVLLSGIVRFSSATPPDPARATETPLALEVALATQGGTYPTAPSCSSEAFKTVTFTRGGGVEVEAVPLAATPAALGVATWADAGDRFVAYHCVVYPLASGEWSGRTVLVASGWTIGNGADDHRVCRFARDLDRSGAVDANIEHPDTYSAVRGPLANQNFLVVAGSQNCPPGDASRSEGSAANGAATSATVQHQP